MNIKQKLSVLAACFFLASCTTENVLDNPQPGGNDGFSDADRREVLMTLKNKFSLVDSKTKAEDPIATAEENYISSLDVYVFGSDTENGTYTFQELFYYRDDASTIAGDGDWAHSFSITATAKDNVSNGLLKLKKGLYVKLYCVANSTQLYQTNGGAVTPYTNFAALKQSNPGQPDNKITPGVPTEDAFKALHSPVIDPARTGSNNVLKAPLPMTGSYLTPLDLTDFSVSTRTQLSFKLARMVARFDVINNAETSKFTIESISMSKGQPGSTLFPVKPLVTEEAKLITYPVRTVDAATQTEAISTTKGAFYTWPSPKEDGGFLILKGKYAANLTDVLDVSYQVPFQQIINGEGSYIEVAYNHRYTIAITKADDYHLDFTLDVADWDDQGPIDDYKPENDFDKDTKVTLLDDVGAYVLDNGRISVLAEEDSKFAFNFGANTALTGELIYKTGSAEWIVEDPAAAVVKTLQADPPSEAESEPTVKPSTTTKFAYKVNKEMLTDKGPLLPVTIRLTNPASGEYKNIVVIATEGPEISWKPVAGNYNFFDPATLTATLYNVANQTIALTVNSETRKVGETTTTGCTATVEAAKTWLTGSGDLGAATGTYTLTLGAVQGDVNSTATVDFKSTASGVTRQITVKLKDPSMTALNESSFVIGSDNKLEISGGSAGNPKVTMFGKVNNTFTVTVISPEKVEAAVTTGGDWLGVSSETGSTLSSGKKQTKITATISDATTAKDDGKITITNPLNNETVVIDVVTELPDGPTVSIGKNDGNLSYYDESSSTATLYSLVGQQIVLNTNEAASMSTTDNWLTASDSKASTHTITVGTAKGGDATGTVSFTNDITGGKTDIKVILKNPAITSPKADNFTEGTGSNTFTAADDTNNAKITMANAVADNACTLTITSPEGITVDDSKVSSWMTVETGVTEGVTGSHTNVVTLTLKDAAAHTGTITLTNAITGGGDITVDIEATAKP